MKKFLSIIFVILWMGLIFNFSSKDVNASRKQSNIIVSQVKKIPALEKSSNRKVSRLVRKSAHFFMYTVFALVLCFAIKINGWGVKNNILVLAIIFIYACSDEIHQLFVDGRGAQAKDVAIDSLGGLTGILIFTTARKVFSKLSFIDIKELDSCNTQLL